MKKSILLSLFISFCSVALANNMLVQNVTTTGNNAVNKTIQVQFDISWDNSWRDAINWDAAWIFMKFKDANGLWQHCQLNQTGFTNGSGTANTVQVTADKVGSWLYRSAQGAGTFNTTGMQLQWNYGLSGLTDVTGLEVRVFAVEMVYVPEGEFNCAGPVVEYLFTSSTDQISSFRYSIGNTAGYNFPLWGNGGFYAPGNNFPVINSRLSPTLTYNDGSEINLKIRGDVGIDFNNDGLIENNTYPTGYNPFYCYKYELTEQQYADLLNTLTAQQISSLGIAGSSITLTDGQYYSATPDKACNNATVERLFAYADWSGLRPMSFLEFQKVCYGPTQPKSNLTVPPQLFEDGYEVFNYMIGYSAWGESVIPENFNSLAGYSANTGTSRIESGASYYGAMQFTGSAIEPVVKLHATDFSALNGDGSLSSSANSDISFWNIESILYVDTHTSYRRKLLNSGYFKISSYNPENYGFRYVRSAE